MSSYNSYSEKNSTEKKNNLNFTKPTANDKDQPNYSQHSFLFNNLNGSPYNNEYLEKIFNENYNYKHEISNMKNKLFHIKLENDTLKEKIKKYVQQSDFLGKKLENCKIPNGSNLSLISNNVNSSTNSLRPLTDFERLYCEKCEEFENFEENFNKISDKFSKVLEKIQLYQIDLIEDNKRLKEFLIFILQCFYHKRFEHINCIINYTKENQTFIDKQIFLNPGDDSYKLIEKNFFEKNNNEKGKMIEYLISEEIDKTTNSKNDLLRNNSNTIKTHTLISDINYQDLKITKSKKNFSESKSKSNHNHTDKREKSKDFSYRELVKKISKNKFFYFYRVNQTNLEQ